MIKVIKTDLFRLFRSWVFYVFPLITVVFLALEMVFSAVIDNESTVETTVVNEESGMETYSAGDGVSENISASDNNAGQGSIGTSNNNGVSENIGTPDNSTGSTEGYTGFGIADLFGFLTNGLIMMLMGFTLVIFATSETRNGFVKTAAGCLPNRGCMAVSKIVTGIVVLFAYIVEYALIRFVFTALFALIYKRPLKYIPLPEGSAGTYACYILLCILAHIAFAALIILIHQLFTSRPLGMVFVFVVSSGLFAEVIGFLSDLIRSSLEILPDFDITKYMMLSNMFSGCNDPSYHPAAMLVMSLVYLAGGTAAAVFTAQKKDIR